MKKPNKFYARVKRGAPTIFTVLSVAGVIATGILSARAANKTRNTEESEKSTVNNFKEGWKNYIPAIAVGGVTIVCSISSNVLNRHQRVALVSAYTLASKSYEDYKRKTKELYGEEAHHRRRRERFPGLLLPLSAGAGNEHRSAPLLRSKPVLGQRGNDRPAGALPADNRPAWAGKAALLLHTVLR